MLWASNWTSTPRVRSSAESEGYKRQEGEREREKERERERERQTDRQTDRLKAKGKQAG